MKNRNLEMVYFLQDMCQKVNFIYLLTHAGIPSSPAACRTRFLPAADQPGEQCGGRGADEKRHCPARLRAEEQKPDCGTDDGIASTGGERAQELLPGAAAGHENTAEKNGQHVDGACRGGYLLLRDHTCHDERRAQRGKHERENAGQCEGQKNGLKKSAADRLSLHSGPLLFFTSVCVSA